MTERILVVDYGLNSFQWMLVDVDGDFKEISEYHCIEVNIHPSSLAKMVEEIFDANKCDKIYMDVMGASMCLYESLQVQYSMVTYGYKLSAQTNHNRIVGLLGDLACHKLFIHKDSIKLYDVIRCLGNEGSLCYSNNGLVKLGKDIDRSTRDKVHMMLGIYK